MDDQEKKGKSSFPSDKIHILWAGGSVLLLAACMIMSIVLSDGDADSDAADKLAETEIVASEAGDVQAFELVEVGDSQSVEVESSNEKTLPFFLVNFEEEGAEIEAFREFLEGKRTALVEPEFHGYQLFSDYEFHEEETVWQLRVGGEATLAELLEAYFADEDSGADEILYALTDIGGDGRHELYVRAQGDKSWGYAQLVMAFYYIGDDLHLSFAEEEGGRSSLTVTAKGYVQSSGSTGAESISGETGRMGADGKFEEWYRFEAGTGAGVHNLLEDWDAYQRVFLDENNSLEEEPQMEVGLYTIDGKQYYEYCFYEEATKTQRDKCQEYLALCEASQGIVFTPQEELDVILKMRQEALGITDDMVGNGLEYPDPIEWRNGFSYVFRGTQEWQQAYYEVLCKARWQNGMAEEQDQLPSEGYYLYDIDKDGIPELLLKHGSCEANYWADIYTWRKGETICLGGIGMGHTSLYTWEGENALLSYWAHMGGAFATKISIDGDEFLWDEFFQEDLYAAMREDSDAGYTDPTELVPGCVCLAEYRIDLDSPLMSYEIVMGTADAAVKNPAGISNEEVQGILLDVIENNGMVYGVTGDGFGGDTGYVSFEEYCAPKSAGKYAKTPLQVDQYVWVDVNGDGQIEMVLDLREDESQKEQNCFCEEIRVILSLQGEVVYAYCLNYENDYLVLEDGAFYVSYGDWSEFTIRYLFDRDECFSYYVANEADAV